MVMSKREKEIFDEALLKIEITKALHWTKEIEPDIPIPKKDITTGWLYELHHKKVFEAWSSSNNHGDMPYLSNYDIKYKKGVALFSTKSRALLALRHAIEMQAAIDMMEIDECIKEATAIEKANLLTKYKPRG